MQSGLDVRDDIAPLSHSRPHAGVGQQTNIKAHTARAKHEPFKQEVTIVTLHRVAAPVVRAAVKTELSLSVTTHRS